MRITIKKFVLFLMLIILICYATSPYWLVQIIKAKVPDNWKVKQLTIAYPTFSGVELNDVDLIIVNQDLSEIELAVSGLKTDLDFNDFKASHILVKITDKPIENVISDQQNIIDLDDLPIEQYLNQLPLIKLKVDVLDLVLDSEIKLNVASKKYQLTALQANIQKEINLKFNLETNQYLSKPLPLEFNLKYQKLLTQLVVLTEQAKIAEISYQMLTEKNQFNLKLNTDSIQKPLTSVNTNLFNMDLSLLERYKNWLVGNVDILVSQDKLTKQLNSRFSFDGQVSFDGLINLEKKSLPIVISAKSASNNFPLIIELDVKANIKQKFELKDLIETNQNISFKDLGFNYSGVLNLDKEKIYLSKNKLIILVDNINSIENELELSQINLQTKIADIQSDQLDLKKLKLNTKIINLILNYKSQNLTTKISGEVNVTDLIDSKISGAIKLNEIKQSFLAESKNIDAEVNLKDLNQALTQGTIDIKLTDHDGKYQGNHYQNIDANLTIKLKAKEVAAKGELLINKTLVTPLSLNLNRVKQSVSVDLAHNPLELSLINNIIEQTLKNHQLNKTVKAQLLAGELSHQGSLQVNNYQDIQMDKLLSNNQIKLSKGKITLNDNVLFNVESKTNIKSISPLLSQTSISADKIELASGLKINKPSVNIALLDDASIEVSQLFFNLLSADVTSEKLIVKNADLKPAIININGLSLTELMFFTELENIYAEGVIDLIMPISSNNSKLMVKNATFKSRDKGIIKYNSGAPSKDKNIALTALENFEYKQLDGVIDYDSEGAYHIKLHLLGANPSLYNGYPLDFTINLSGELPGLFKSTFLTGNFEESILNAMHAESELKK